MERRGDRLGVQVADRPGDRPGWPVVVDVRGADVRSELPRPRPQLAELGRSECCGDGVVQRQSQLVQRLRRLCLQQHCLRPDRRLAERGDWWFEVAQPFLDRRGNVGETGLADLVGEPDSLRGDVQPLRRNQVEVRQVPEGVLVAPD